MHPDIEQALKDLIAREKQGEANYNLASQIFQTNVLTGYVKRLNDLITKKNSRKNQIINRYGIPEEKSEPSIPTPTSPIHALNHLLTHDYDTTDKARWTIIEAESKNEPAVAIFVKGLVDEQTAEEATASELLDKSRKAYNHRLVKLGLGLIDEDLLN